MTPRIGLDLEVGIQIARQLPELDLLDIAYGAVHGGAEAILVPMTAFLTGAIVSAQLFDRPGLPLFAVKTEIKDLDRVPSLGAAVDRIVVVGENGRGLVEPGEAAQNARQIAGAGQEVGVLCEAEAGALKELAKARVQWAYFPTAALFRAVSTEEAQDEIAKLTSAALAASRIRLRVALWGATGNHLPSALASIPFVEEIYPTPDLWSMALRSGWERAVSEYRYLMR